VPPAVAAVGVCGVQGGADVAAGLQLSASPVAAVG
jgi:hypothetical protein